MVRPLLGSMSLAALLTLATGALVSAESPRGTRSADRAEVDAAAGAKNPCAVKPVPPSHCFAQHWGHPCLPRDPREQTKFANGDPHAAYRWRIQAP